MFERQIALLPPALVRRKARWTAQDSIGRHAMASTALFVVLILGLGLWAATTNISGAVIAPGSVVIEGGSKSVQHQEGGIVREILVDNEDRVEAGQVLIRLDDTAVQATLSVVNFQLNEAWASHSRLVAETIDADDMLPPPEGVGDQDPSFTVAFALQDQLRSARRQAETSKVLRIAEQKRQMEIKIEGLQAQSAAFAKQLAIVAADAENAQSLFSRGLMPISRLNDMQRELAQLEGQIFGIDAEIAQTRSAIVEVEASQDQVGDEFRTSALSELQAVNNSISELSQQKIAAEDRLARLELRAPQAGVVHQSRIHTVGGIINPSDTVMLVVPETSELSVKVRVDPREIDSVQIKQAVVLHFSGLDPRTTPEINALVSSISPDVVTDANGNGAYYTVNLAIDPQDLEQLLPTSHLVPGMPVEAFMTTSDRTVLYYLFEPILKQLQYAMR